MGRSKTIASPITRVYKAWQSPAGRRKWLTDADFKITAAQENKTLRLLWVDGTSRAQIDFVDKGDKTAVTVQHGKLKDRESRRQDEEVLGRSARSPGRLLRAVSCRR